MRRAFRGARSARFEAQCGGELGAAEVEALGFVAAQLDQQLPRGFVLDAFGDDRRPRLCARSMVERTMARSLGSRPMSLTNERSIFSSSTGSFLR